MQEGKSSAKDEDDLDDDLEDDANAGKPLTTTFELNDTLYAEAELEDTDTVYLWLGVRPVVSPSCVLCSHWLKANVMLEYKLPAAVSLLRSKLEAAQTSLTSVIEDLEFLREQITVMEVNTARVDNWDVKRRREWREKEAQAGKTESKSAS